MPMNKEIFYGYVPSEIDGTELVIQEYEYKSLPLPAVYSYLSFMSPIMNQGTESTCVPHSISAAYDYYNAMMNPDSTSEGKFTATGISIHQIYNAKTNVGEGMSYKEALEFCKKHGVVTEKEYIHKVQNAVPRKIYDYARILSQHVMKQSLVINGPVMIATYVRDLHSPAFWKGNSNYGGHATCLIGYDDNREAFLLRNSWGTDFGNKGYVWFPYKDFNSILEAWTIIV